MTKLKSWHEDCLNYLLTYLLKSKCYLQPSLNVRISNVKVKMSIIFPYLPSQYTYQFALLRISSYFLLFLLCPFRFSLPRTCDLPFHNVFYSSSIPFPHTAPNPPQTRRYIVCFDWLHTRHRWRLWFKQRSHHRRYIANRDIDLSPSTTIYCRSENAN